VKKENLSSLFWEIGELQKNFNTRTQETVFLLFSTFNYLFRKENWTIENQNQREKNLSSISERQDDSQKKILILGLRKQFSSTFLLSIAFLEKRIGLSKIKLLKKNLSSLFLETR